jgi:1-acyl-sn-glycerol-3-phosphate acyltransferase
MIIRLFQILSLVILKPFFYLLFRPKVEGLENIKNLKKPLIVAANHNSWTDAFLISFPFLSNPSNLPIRFACLAKLFYFPLLLPFLFLTGNFPVQKGLGLEKNLALPVKILKNKGVVGMFPEGRRFRGEIMEPRRGVAFLAFQAKADILPIKIIGNEQMALWKAFLGKYRVKVKFGKVFSLPEIRQLADRQPADRQPEGYNELANFVMNNIRRI